MKTRPLWTIGEARKPLGLAGGVKVHLIFSVLTLSGSASGELNGWFPSRKPLWRNAGHSLEQTFGSTSPQPTVITYTNVLWHFPTDWTTVITSPSLTARMSSIVAPLPSPTSS